MQRGQSKSTTNGQKGQPTPRNEIELYEMLIKPTVKDPFLSDNNLGLGNYSRREFWQQVDSFKKGLYAEAAFARLLFDRAVYQTKCALAREEFEDKAVEKDGGAYRVVEAEDRELTLNEYVGRNADRCWEDLGDDVESVAEENEAKLQALERHAGLTREWTSPFHRMIMARHEASRSRGGRVLDNATGRVREIRGEGTGNVQEQLGRQ